MLRLNLASEPEWLELGHGVRVRVVPCTSGVMAAARGSAAVEALVAAGASEAELALALAKAMAGIAILDWEGVGIRPVGRAYKALIAEWQDVLPTQSVCLTVPIVLPDEYDTPAAARRRDWMRRFTERKLRQKNT